MAGARTAGEFFAGLLAGRGEVHGRGGTPLVLSHGLYKTAYAFGKDRLGKSHGETPALLEKLPGPLW